jgi:hypothetical protein
MFSPPFLARRDINEYNVLSKYIGSFGPRNLRIFSPLLVFSGNSHGYKVLLKNILGIFQLPFLGRFSFLLSERNIHHGYEVCLPNTLQNFFNCFSVI